MEKLIDIKFIKNQNKFDHINKIKKSKRIEN